ncbi:MAG: hypothetical protein WCY76_10695 [Leucobacter sp.]
MYTKIGDREDAGADKMNDKIAKPVNGSFGTIDGVDITEDVVARLVKMLRRDFLARRFGRLAVLPVLMNRHEPSPCA